MSGDMASWKDNGACRHHPDPEIFFASEGTLEHYAAKTVCDSCPVRPTCFEAGVHEAAGMWGGFGEDERAQMREVLQLTPARKPCAICGGSLDDEDRPTATRHERCASKAEQARRAREAQAAPGRCKRCGAEMTWGISKCGACTWSPRSGPNSLPY